MKYTGNYNLKKPEGTDVVNIDDLNDNADIIDQKIKEIENSVENIEVPVTSVNNKTGDVELTAEDIGAETPEGAQEKADAAEVNAKNYAASIRPTKVSQLQNDTGYITEQRKVSDSVTSTSSTTAASSKAVKTAYDKANSAYSYATSATNIRDKLKTVDGSGSGIDADLLDGKHASEFESAINTLGGSVEYTDYTAIGQTITKTIPIGSGKKRGIATIFNNELDYRDYPGQYGILVFFNTNNLDTKIICNHKEGVMCRRYAGKVTDKDYIGSVVFNHNSNKYELKEMYIDGSNIKLVIENTSTKYDGNLGCRIDWEVW